METTSKTTQGDSAVFTASASHMTAAKVLDTISRMPVISSEANDAVPAYAQVNMSDVSRQASTKTVSNGPIRTQSIWPCIGRAVTGKKMGGSVLARMSGHRHVWEVLMEHCSSLCI